MVRQLAQTLREIHQTGVVHRDLKPDNVLVTPDMSPIVLDFDLATEREALSLLNKVLGPLDILNHERRRADLIFGGEPETPHPSRATSVTGIRYTGHARRV